MPKKEVKKLKETKTLRTFSNGIHFTLHITKDAEKGTCELKVEHSGWPDVFYVGKGGDTQILGVYKDKKVRIVFNRASSTVRDVLDLAYFVQLFLHTHTQMLSQAGVSICREGMSASIYSFPLAEDATAASFKNGDSITLSVAREAVVQQPGREMRFSFPRKEDRSVFKALWTKNYLSATSLVFDLPANLDYYWSLHAIYGCFPFVTTITINGAVSVSASCIVNAPIETGDLVALLRFHNYPQVSTFVLNCDIHGFY